MRGSPQIKILVVDDESDNAQLFEALLAREGYGVSTTSDPTKVLSMLKEDDFHLVILDVMMPKMDGFSLLKEIRSVDKKTPVFFLTAKNMKEDMLAGYGAGADHPLTIRCTIRKTGEDIVVDYGGTDPQGWTDRRRTQWRPAGNDSPSCVSSWKS